MADQKHSRDELGYTESERKRLEKLRQRDLEVRQHEQAHIAASGGLTRGGANYTLTKGPDGQMYAIAGHVQIDTSPGPTPEATIEKAQRIKAAALAPADPSPEDLKVAARASMMEMRARGELKAARESENGENAEAAMGGAAAMAQSAFGESSALYARTAGSGLHDASDGAEHEFLEARSMHAGRFRINAPGHLANCPHCQQQAFVGRFQPQPSEVFGVA